MMNRVKPKSAIETAIDALAYTEQLLSIFVRSRNGEYLNEQQDYAVHKNGMPFDENPCHWVSTPFIPVYVSSLFKQAAASASEIERPIVQEFAQRAANDLQKIVDMKDHVPAHYTTSMGNVQDSAKSALLDFKAILEAPANV